VEPGALSRMGLHRLHQVLALPRAGLAKRFPEEVSTIWIAAWAPGSGTGMLCATDFFEVPRIELNFDVGSHQALTVSAYGG